MKKDHLSIETMARWLAGDLPHEDLLREVVPHHMARCPECRKTHEEVLHLQREFEHWDERVAVFEGREAPRLAAELSELPFEEQLTLVEREGRFQAWGLCQFLLKESRRAGFEEPAKAVNLAELALTVVERLTAEPYDVHWVLDLKAKAWAYLGNAHRVLGELRTADTAFRKAGACLDESTTGNLEVRAEILDLKASLRRNQRRLAEALELSEEAIQLHRQSDNFHTVGRALLNKAKTLEEKGDLANAIDLLQEAGNLLDVSREPRLIVYAHHNLLVCLTRSERYEEAERLLPEIRTLFTKVAGPIDQVRLRWVEANVALGLGRTNEAEAAFREVQEQFFEHRMGYDAALVSLDLALLYSRQGRTAELKRLAAEIVPAFESREVHREAMAALLMFQHACEEETLTARLIQHLSTLLTKARGRRE